MRCVLAHYSSNAVSAAPPGRAPWEADRGTHHPNYVAILLRPGNLVMLALAAPSASLCDCDHAPSA
jgi:hypothetical protein